MAPLSSAGLGADSAAAALELERARLPATAPQGDALAENLPVPADPTSADSRAFAVPRGTIISGVVTELRDIFATVSELAGISTPPSIRPLDGKPLTCLLRDPSGKSCQWREYVDLEHAT